jgi:hypothetical protein
MQLAMAMAMAVVMAVVMAMGCSGRRVEWERGRVEEERWTGQRQQLGFSCKDR